MTVLLVSLGGLAGCNRAPDHRLVAETEEPNFEEGMRLKRQGREQEAQAAFYKVVESRAQGAPESHLELGLIYQKKDPLVAIYHFRRYLELVPANDERRPRVEDQKRAAEREFARSLPARPLENQELRNDLMDMVARLQDENARLKQELQQEGRGTTAGRTSTPTAAAGSNATRSPISAVREPATASVTPASPPPNPTPASRAGSRIHTVVRGDTLYNLARHYYNNSTRSRDIYAANRDKMKSDSDLQIGMQLVIPD